MSIPNFEDIFYPSAPNMFKSLLPDFAPDSEKQSRVVLLPHSELSVVAPLIYTSLSYLKPAKNILVLSAFHSTTEAGLYGTDQKEMDSVFGKAKLNTFDTLMTRPQLFEGEYTTELTINALMRYYPNSTYYPIMCAMNSKKDIASLKAILTFAMTSGFSIVVSGNITAKDSKVAIDKEVTLLTSLLRERAPLLDEIRRGHINSCCAYILEALSIIPSPLEFLSFKCGTYTSPTLEIEKGDGSIYFASAKINL